MKTNDIDLNHYEFSKLKFFANNDDKAKDFANQVTQACGHFRFMHSGSVQYCLWGVKYNKSSRSGARVGKHVFL